MRPRALCILAALFVGARTDAQQPTPAQIARIDSLALALLGTTSGLTIAVAHRASAPWVKGYGLADRERGVPATANTVYRIRSISKTFAAASVLQLAAAGRVALDSDVTHYLPDAPTRGQRISVRQILSHTSGLPNYHGAVWRAHYHEKLPPLQWVHLFDAEPLSFSPGTDYAYSNLGFDLIALLIERVSGESFPEYLRRHVTGPIGLRNVSHCNEEAPPKNRAAPYDPRDGKLVPADAWSDVTYGAGMLCGTAGDLVTWARALDDRGVIDPRWLAEMRAPTQIADGSRFDYGLGTRLGAMAGHVMLGHSGSGGGWASHLVDLPGDSLAIAVLTNTENESAPGRLAIAIAGLLLDVPATVARPLPTRLVAADSGRWLNRADTATISPMGEGLGIRPGGAPSPAPLEYLGGNRFRLVPDPTVELQFLPSATNPDSTRATTRVAIYANGFFTSLARRVK